jgi:hypothetical protein
MPTRRELIHSAVWLAASGAAGITRAFAEPPRPGFIKAAEIAK